jgi:hypothetical protein
VMEHLPAFAYDTVPLPSSTHIRLVDVRGGASDAPLELALMVHALPTRADASLSSNELSDSFEALSYCWGDPTVRLPAFCNGARIMLTESLHAALLHFRHAASSRSRRMWADQVCINQADEAEKGEQVQLMPRIYSSASYVRVWLGSNPDVKSLLPTIPPGAASNIAKARSFIPDFDDMQPDTVRAASLQSREDAKARHERGEANLLDYDWQTLGAILARSWFQRKWIIQELCLARLPVILFAGGPGGGGDSVSDSQGHEDTTVHWVNVQLEWKCLGELIAGLSSLKWQPRLAKMDMTEASRSFNRALVNCDSLLMMQRYRHVGQLIDAIMVSAGFDCKEPRDQVYGLLGLEAPGPGRTITPDYSASETEVFVRLATAFLLHGGTNALKILAMAPDLVVIPTARGCRQRPAGLPSWVPDVCSLQTDCLVDTTLRPPLFRAGGELTPSVRLDASDSKVLGVRGKVVDTVETIALSFVDHYLRDFPDAGPHDRDLWDPNKLRQIRRTIDWLKGCLKVAREAVGRSSHTRTGLPRECEISFARTMLCGMETGRSPLSDELLAEFPAYLEWLADRASRASRAQDGYIVASLLTEESDLQFQHEIESSLSGLAAPRRFGVTRRARFCHLPFRAKPGDQICVLGGSAVPFVIREVVADADPMFEVVGACYLDGSMAGEEMQGQDAEASLEWIDLQ